MAEKEQPPWWANNDYWPPYPPYPCHLLPVDHPFSHSQLTETQAPNPPPPNQVNQTYYACTDEHEGRDIGLTREQQTFHHQHGYHYHWHYPPAVAAPPAPPVQPAPVHYHMAEPAAQQPEPPQENIYRYVPAGAVPSQEARTRNLWHGRRTEEVNRDHDNIARAAGAYAPKHIAPGNAQPGDRFMVQFPNGQRLLFTLSSIQNSGWTGYWQQDQSGALYYVRTS